MNFKHKLSRRLAILQTLAVSLSVALGCTGADGDAVGPDALDDPTTIVAVQVKPPTMTLETGQLGRFTARGYTASGDSTVGLVDWTASGGTITADGVFSSTVAGTYTVVGKKRGRGKQPVDTSIVVVIPPDTSLVAITIAPGQDTLLTSGTQAFTVTGRARDSSTVTQIAASWSATGGSIDGSGTYHAGSAAGRYRVIATTAAGTVADTVPVTIVSPPPAALTQVVLTPATASLTAGGSLQFKPYARTSAGDSVAVTPAYTATGGTVSAAGLYTAGSTAGTYRVVASSAGLADSAVVTVTAAAPTLTRVILTPASVSVNTGASAQFAAYGRNSAGDSIPVTASFSATGGTITAAGLFTAGTTIGNFRVIAVQSGLADTSAVTITTGSTGSHAGTQVTTQAQAASAFNGSYGSAAPGDTIWFRAGTYAGSPFLVSASNRVFRAWPGEHVRINGALAITGSGNTVWGLEIVAATSQNLMGINVRAANTRLINNVVHHATGTGIGFWMEAPNSELSGNVVYHNGGNTNQDHGVYVENSSGTKLIRDNLVFDNAAYGFHLYGETGQYVRYISLIGNIAYENGFAGRRDDILLGSSEISTGIVVDTNYTYGADRSTFGVNLPWSYGPVQGSLVERGNYFAGQVNVPGNRWTSLTQSGNTTIGTAPGSNKIVVRANPYEAGRGQVAIYRWVPSASVTVDLSRILSAGQPYRVMSPTAMWGTPVASGTYTGQVSLPTPAQFQAYVVVSP
jgi:parallel beta-helix repeat protein